MNFQPIVSGLAILLLLVGSALADGLPGHCSLEDNISSEQLLEIRLASEKYTSIEAYQQRILQLESDAGAYSEQLAPVLIGMGLYQQEEGLVEDASKTLERALHIVRINDGLYSPRQLPLLELLIETNIAAEQWKKVANSYDWMYWLYTRNYERNDSSFLPIVKRFRQWHIDAYNKDTGRSLSQHFNAADKLYEHGMSIIRQCTENRQQALCFWHRSCCADAPKDGPQCPVDPANL